MSASSWGHALRPLTAAELARVADSHGRVWWQGGPPVWSCFLARFQGCRTPAAYRADYIMAQARGSCRRHLELCSSHAEHFAKRHGLTFPPAAAPARGPTP